MENRSLKRLSVYVLIMLMLIVLVFSAGSYQMNMKMGEISKVWLSFKSQYAEKARLETNLLATLGYGGMIHAFKNYILRKDSFSASIIIGLIMSLAIFLYIIFTRRNIRPVQELSIVMSEMAHGNLDIANSSYRCG